MINVFPIVKIYIIPESSVYVSMV